MFPTAGWWTFNELSLALLNTLKTVNNFYLTRLSNTWITNHLTILYLFHVFVVHWIFRDSCCTDPETIGSPPADVWKVGRTQTVASRLCFLFVHFWRCSEGSLPGMRGKLKMEMIWVKVRKSLKHEYFVWKSSLDHTLFVTEFRALGGLNRSSEGFRSFEEENGSRRKEKHNSNRFSQISKYHKYHI